MLEKTKGIVLHQFRYTDTGIVVHLYTRKFGRISMLVRGIGRKKSGKHNIMFQPMFVLDLEMYFKPSREVQLAKEISLSWSPFGIQSDIRKSTVAMFLGEVLSSVLKEESPHEDLFDYIEHSVLWFDECREHFVNFHIAFLAGLSSYLGIEPSPRHDSSDAYFDMKNGRFVPLPPVHGEYCDEEVSGFLALFFGSTFDTSAMVSMTGKVRNEVLGSLVRFYSLHLPALKKFNSLDVLKEVFS